MSGTPQRELAGWEPPGGSIAVALLSLRGRSFARARASTRSPSSARLELILVCAICVAASAALFGAHVVDGGRYLDDWWLSAYIKFPRELGFSSAYSYLNFYSGARPGAVVYWLVTYWLFGFHYAWHRALGVGLCAALASVFYLLLRELQLSRRDAAAITALSLALPIADSIHFWVTPDVAQLCLATCAGGLLLSVRALRSSGRRAVALRLGAGVLYVVSMLIAETTVPIIGLSVLIYRTQVDWRRAASQWAPDAAVAAIASVHYLSTGAQRAAGGGVAAYLHHARVLGDQALTLLAGAVAPFAHSRGWVLIVLLALGGWIAIQLRSGSAAATLSETRFWARTAGLAVVFAALSYVIYVPSNATYEPLVSGVGNRINIGALLPLSVLAFALARLIGGLVPWRRAAGIVTVVLWGVMVVGGTSRLEADRFLWDKAASQQSRVLAALHHALPRPPFGAALLVFGAPGVVTHFERVGVTRVNVSAPVFSTWWELDAAVKLTYGRSDLDAYPIWAFQPPQLACGRGGVYQLGLDGVRHLLLYGDVYVINVETRSSMLLRGERQCARVVSHSTTIRFDLPV